MQQKKSIFRIILKLLAAFILTIVVYYFFPESKLPAGSKVDKILKAREYPIQTLLTGTMQHEKANQQVLTL